MNTDRIGKMVILIITMFISIAGNVNAELMQTFDNGKVDWQGGYIYATGIGSANMENMVNEVVAEQSAIKAARHFAYQELNEMVNSINIDGDSVYRDQVAIDDILRAKTEGIIKGAHIDSKKFEWTKRGSPRAEVTISLPIAGYNGISGVVANWAARAIKKKPQPERFVQTVQKNLEMSEKYTGLIIDGRNIGLETNISPKIFTANGKEEVYGTRSVDIQAMTFKGIVGYSSTIETAKKTERIGSNPLYIKGLKAIGNRGGNVDISIESAQKIVAADVGVGFLQQCKVVFLIN